MWPEMNAWWITYATHSEGDERWSMSLNCCVNTSTLGERRFQLSLHHSLIILESTNFRSTAQPQAVREDNVATGIFCKVWVCVYIYIICIGCTSILSACLWEMLKRSCILITSPNPGNLILTAREREQLKVTDFRVCGSLVFTILLTLLLPEIKSKPHLTSERLQFASKVLPKPQL